MISTIYLDMDDVLCDFSNHYHEKIGINPRDIHPDDWEENWHRWVSGNYFRTQPMMDGARLLLDYVASTGIKTEILSSTGGPDFFEEIVTQKLDWLKANGINYHANIVPGKKFKTQFATPHRMLIDDQFGIIEKWNAAGGVGVHHEGDAIKTIQTIQDILLLRGYKTYE